MTGPLDAEGDAGDLVFHVEGISLTVQAVSDESCYETGEGLVVTLAITNSGAVDTGELTALAAFNGVTRTQVVSLTPGTGVEVTFPYTATFAGDRKVFYGIYGLFGDRGAHLDTLYLYRCSPWATLRTDKQVYLPGETLSATLATTLTQGTLTVYAFGEAYTLTLGIDTGLTMDVPVDAERGSHAIYYVVHGCSCEADGREQATWFDVAAPWVRVIESQLGTGPYQAGDAVSASLTIASDLAQDIEVRAWLRYPDGSDGVASAHPAHLLASPDNHVVITVAVTDSQMGLHQLLYEMGAPSTEGTPQPDGMEAFDIGPAGLDRVTTDQESYESAVDAVLALLDIYVSEGSVDEVALTLDRGPATTRPVTLTAGYHTLTVTLDGPIPAGERELTATLSIDGYWASRQTGFEYGTSLPDLRPGSPWVGPGGILTRTVSAVVGNDGQGGATATSAHFYDGDPSQGGSPIGTESVPALDSGDQAMISLVWDTAGEGGDHTVYVSVDPVDEFDEENNSASGSVTLPRLSSALAVSPPSIGAGESVAVEVTLVNLQATAVLPVTATVWIHSPAGTAVFSQTWEVTLSGGEGRLLGTSWQSTWDADAGVYPATVQATDVYDGYELDNTFFVVSLERSYLYIPLIVRNQS